MTESLFRRLVLRFALLPVVSLCIFLSILGLRIHQITVNRAQVSRTTSLVIGTTGLQQSMIDEESGIRGYLVTRDSQFLEPYREASGRLDAQLAALSAAARDASEADRAASISGGFRTFANINQALLKSDLSQQEVYALLRQQKQAMDSLRGKIDDLLSSESARREAGIKEITSLFNSLPVIGILGGALVALLLAAHGIYLFHKITAAFGEQLAESDGRAASMLTTLQSIGDAVVVCDRLGRISLINPTAEQLTGWTSAEAIGQPLDRVFVIVNESTRQAVESPVAKVGRLGIVVDLANHTVLIRKDKTEVPIDDSGAPIRNSSGELIGIILVFRSIADRRQAENALRLSEERLRLALTAARNVGIWDWDVPNGRVHTDTNFAQLYGVDPAKAKSGMSFAEFTRSIHPDDAPRVGDLIDRALVSCDDFAAEYRLITPDGSERWVSAAGRCSPGPDGLPLRFPGVTVDITGQKQIEEALRESESRFQSIYTASLEYIGLLDPQGVVLDCNRALLAFADAKREEVVGRNFADAPWFAFTRGVPELIRNAVAEAAGGRLVRTELPLRRPSGEIMTFDFSLAPVYDAAGNVLFLVPEGRDIGDMKRVDDALRASEERLRIATETARLGTWELDLANGRMESSGICREHFGLSPNDPFRYEQLLNATLAADRPVREASVQRAIEENSVYRIEHRIEWPDESVHWILASGRMLLDGNHMPARMIGVTLDVTDRRKAEAALLQSEKLAAVGRLSASIAHEINNPLEAVTNLLYLARKGNDLQEIHNFLEIAERELRRASVITTQTLRFHKQASKPRPALSAQLLEGVLSIYQGRMANSHVQLHRRDRASKPIICYDGEIRQVLNNLVGNAIDAIPPVGGSLFVRSREATEWKSGRRGLLFTIADTGSGIDRHMVEKIFDPSCTTKGLSGTGLGLWVSKEIVDRHTGVLRVRSRQGSMRDGTVFTLFLPFEAAIE